MKTGRESKVELGAQGRARCPHRPARIRAARGFTMVEIALCLAIIGFALVAIIGVLPTGLNVQKDNREETVINQDAVVWMDAIRNGSQGMDDLTNYVLGITNTWSQYDNTGVWIGSGKDTYDQNGSVVTSLPIAPTCPLTNGLRIVGLLSTPRLTPLPGGRNTRAGVQSNYVVAIVRAMSGYAIEKFPQNNPTLLDASFTYRLIPEVLSCPTNFQFLAFIVTNSLLPVPIDTNTIYSLPITYTNVGVTPQNYAVQTNTIWNLENNLNEIRLTFRWPMLPGGKIGNGRQVFRLTTGGQVIATNDPSQQVLYFLKPSFYANAKVLP
jgi:type II secretory pathway pseudopilin PulG